MCLRSIIKELDSNLKMKRVAEAEDEEIIIIYSWLYNGAVFMNLLSTLSNLIYEFSLLFLPFSTKINNICLAFAPSRQMKIFSFSFRSNVAPNFALVLMNDEKG